MLVGGWVAGAACSPRDLILHHSHPEGARVGQAPDVMEGALLEGIEGRGRLRRVGRWRAFGVVGGTGGECTRRVRGHEPTTRGGAEDAAEGGGAPTHPGQKSTWVPSCRRLPSVITQPGFPKSLFVLGGVGTKLLMHPKFW